MLQGSFLKTLGPGIVTGASDDDPSGIGTYSQVGAQFGYGLLWTMLISYPLMAAIQEISARIGWCFSGARIPYFKKSGGNFGMAGSGVKGTRRFVDVGCLYWPTSADWHLCASNCFCRLSVASLTLRSADSGALNSWLHDVQAATQGAAPMCFTMRTSRFGLSPGGMVKMVQDGAGDEAKNHQNSARGNALNSAVMTAIMTPAVSRSDGRT